MAFIVPVIALLSTICLRSSLAAVAVESSAATTSSTTTTSASSVAAAPAVIAPSVSTVDVDVVNTAASSYGYATDYIAPAVSTVDYVNTASAYAAAPGYSYAAPAVSSVDIDVVNTASTYGVAPAAYVAPAVSTSSIVNTASTVSTAVPAVSSMGIVNAASAVNDMTLVNHLYNSPYIPSGSIYGVDMLNNPPYRAICDCDYSTLIDPTVYGEIALVTTKYNQRPCDLQQWERLININMPGIDPVNELNMLSSLASSVQREQVRGNLAYGTYPDFCVNYPAPPAPSVATTTTATSSATVLARREPQVAASSSATSTTTTTTSAANPWDNTPAYYTMQYLIDRALPQLSPDLRLDVIHSVMANTPAQYWSSAYPLSQQLTSNIRGMVSDMVNLSGPSVTVTY